VKRLAERGTTYESHYCPSPAPNQLFNIADDRDELENRIDSETAIVEDMEQELRNICDPDFKNEPADRFIKCQLAAIEDGDLETLPIGNAVYRS
jgi:hypothetical protein